MHKEAREELRVRLKLVVLEQANHFGVTKACREFNLPRSTFYRWKQKYDKEGWSGPYGTESVAYSHPRRTSPDVIEKVLEIPTDHQLGALRITYYLDCYHGDPNVESPWDKLLAKDSSQMCSSHQTVCKRVSRTPRSGRCEVLTIERKIERER